MIWDQDKYINAWNFASVAHGAQKLPGGSVPYINHIGLVAQEVMAVMAVDSNVKDPDLCIQCALLHDVIEDTVMSSVDIEELFGTDVSNGVLALSKNTNLPTKMDQLEDSVLRIKQQPKEVWMVKLADRITNLQPPPSYWSISKIDSYREEAIFILDCLGEANDILADRLRSKINIYNS